MPNETIQELEKRLCISYLDEADPFKDCGYNIKTMVSVTALKSEYISKIEKDWKNLRDKYKVPAGLCLHFTDILLLTSKKEKCKPEYQKLFADQKGDIDLKKMHQFYIDLLEMIEKSNFVFQATGIAALKEKRKLIPRIKEHSIMYQLFSEHIDRIAFYMADLTTDEYKAREAEYIKKGQKQKISNMEPKYYFTKLRYDGSYQLHERNDYRNAFSHCIADGTKHFTSKVTKEVFDNLTFVSKEEVGQAKDCPNPCSIEVISHAGAEIVDFAAKFIAREMWKEFYKDYLIKVDGKKEEDAAAEIETLCTITIPGHQTIKPMNTLEKKLFESPDVAKTKCIIDHPY